MKPNFGVESIKRHGTGAAVRVFSIMRRHFGWEHRTHADIEIDEGHVRFTRNVEGRCLVSKTNDVYSLVIPHDLVDLYDWHIGTFYEITEISKDEIVLEKRENPAGKEK